MTLQKILQHFKTVKLFHSSNPNTKVADAIITTLLTTTTIATSSQQIPSTTTTTILSNLTPNLVHLIITDPHLYTPKCLHFFNFLIKNQSLMSFKLTLHTNLSLLCRVVKSRHFLQAEKLLSIILFSQNQSYPFADIASGIQNMKISTKIAAKLFNLVFKVFSDNHSFQQVLEVFNFMLSSGIAIDERPCTIYLSELIKCDWLELAIAFFYRMLDADVKVSVFSVTVVVDGLCKCGEIKKGREFVEEMLHRGIKPNMITWNTMVGLCTRRWYFDELDKVLLLMRRESVEFSYKTFKLLLDGFLSSGKLEDAEVIVSEMHGKGYKVETYMCNSIINGYCRVGDMNSAFCTFSKMKEREICPNTDTYWILVIGLCKAGEIKAAKELEDDMQARGFDLDIYTFDILVDRYCSELMIDDAIRLLMTMQKKRLIIDSWVYEMILSGLCKLNRMEQAVLMLHVLVKRGMATEVTYFISLIESSGLQVCVPKAVPKEHALGSDLYSDLIMVLQGK